MFGSSYPGLFYGGFGLSGAASEPRSNPDIDGQYIRRVGKSGIILNASIENGIINRTQGVGKEALQEVAIDSGRYINRFKYNGNLIIKR